MPVISSAAAAYLQLYSYVLHLLQGYLASHFRLRWWQGMHAFLARLRLIVIDMLPTGYGLQNLQPLWNTSLVGPTFRLYCTNSTP